MFSRKKELGIDGEKMVSVTLALHAGDISKQLFLYRLDTSQKQGIRLVRSDDLPFTWRNR